VASTLSLPVLVSGYVVGSVNLYASSSDAFDGRHEALARIFDAWAPGAVTNAGSPSTTRRVAERAPELLREDVDLAIASSVIANRDNLSYRGQPPTTPQRRSTRRSHRAATRAHHHRAPRLQDSE
jgi:hypothetical protein